MTGFSSDGVDKVMSAAIDERRLVGGVVLVGLAGETVLRQGYGLADREAGLPMVPDARFRLASITKPLVTAAALALVEHRVLDLTSPITRWLPTFRPALADGSQPDITLHQLLTHTSGLGYEHGQPPGSPYGELAISSGLDQPGLSFDEELGRLAAAPLGFAPGTAWNYSLGIDVAGAVMAAAATSTLPDLLARLVTGPLGMTHTSFAAVDGELVTPYADASASSTPVEEPIRMADPQDVPHEPGLAPLRYSPSRAYDPGSFPSGGAGANATADDLFTFFQAILEGGEPILSPVMVARMITNRIGDLRINTEPTGSFGFGYGASVLLDPARAGSPQPRGTWSWGGAWGHDWFVDFAHGLISIELTNTAVAGMTGEVPEQLTAAVYAGLPT